MRKMFAGVFFVFILAASTYPQTHKSEVTPASRPQTASCSLPLPTGFVTDYAGAIDEESKVRLERTLADLKQNNKVSFAVVTVTTTGDESVFDYSLRIARSWRKADSSLNEEGALL